MWRRRRYVAIPWPSVGGDGAHDARRPCAALGIPHPHQVPDRKLVALPTKREGTAGEEPRVRPALLRGHSGKVSRCVDKGK